MFEVSSKKVNFLKKNSIIKKNINLDSNLDCFVLIDCANEKFAELLMNNILEYLIGRISTNDTYNSFQASLENINSFVKTWSLNKDQEELKLSVIIGILNKNNFVFSTIGRASCYLLKNNKELIEITDDDNKSKPKDFNFISNGSLNDGEIVIMGTTRILAFLSENDIVDGLNTGEDIKGFNKNIKEILLTESVNRNVGITSIKYNALSREYISENKWLLLKDFFIKILDNDFIKKIIQFFFTVKAKLLKQNKNIKNIVFLGGILICLIFLYSIINTVIGVSTSNEKNLELKDNLTKAKTYLSIASENLENEEIFNLNIENAEGLIKEVKDKELYLSDVTKLNDDINLLKNQFNKIDTFESDPENYILEDDLTNGVKIIKNNKKTYLIKNKSVVGPILPDSKPKETPFNKLENGEFFVDAANIGTDIYLMTNFSKIVKFSSNSNFSYVDVSGQATWSKSLDLESYAQNIYLVGEEDNQIYKHSKNGDNFSSGLGYLTEDDLEQIGGILSIAIDGGFYILKNDLSMVKFFSSPKYRLESLVLNKLPKNYNLEPNSKVELNTRVELNYVYLLMNDKIWIFKPNSNDFRNTQSLTYIGQMEGQDEIKDFYVNYDGEILVLNQNGIYKLNFEVSDDRIIIR